MCVYCTGRVKRKQCRHCPWNSSDCYMQSLKWPVFSTRKSNYMFIFDINHRFLYVSENFNRCQRETTMVVKKTRKSITQQLYTYFGPRFLDKRKQPRDCKDPCGRHGIKQFSLNVYYIAIPLVDGSPLLTETIHFWTINILCTSCCPAKSKTLPEKIKCIATAYEIVNQRKSQNVYTCNVLISKCFQKKHIKSYA